MLTRHMKSHRGLHYSSYDGSFLHRSPARQSLLESDLGTSPQHQPHMCGTREHRRDRRQEWYNIPAFYNRPSESPNSHHRTGQQQKLEILIFAENSIYAKTRIIRYSPDPVARSIALQEFMQLVEITRTAPTAAEMDAFAAELAANGTVGFNETMDAVGGTGGNQSDTVAGNKSWVPTLSVAGGLTNVTGGVDNTL